MVSQKISSLNIKKICFLVEYSQTNFRIILKSVKKEKTIKNIDKICLIMFK